MENSASNRIKRGQTIAFRIPSDTPDHILKQLQKLKETEKRNFSSKIAGYVLQGASQSLLKERETITIPIPQKLTKAQRDWLKHEHSEALLGNIVFHLINDPMRSTSLLAALNSKSIDIDQALYLQEKVIPHFETETELIPPAVESKDSMEMDTVSVQNDWNADDDMNGIDWTSVMQEQSASKDEEDLETEESIDDLLGGFLAQMNK